MSKTIETTTCILISNFWRQLQVLVGKSITSSSIFGLENLYSKKSLFVYYLILHVYFISRS